MREQEKYEVLGEPRKRDVQHHPDVLWSTRNVDVLDDLQFLNSP